MRHLCGSRRVQPARGSDLKKESLAVTVGGKNIFEATDMSIVKFREFIDALELTPMQQAIGAPILKGDSGEDQLPYQCRSGISFPVACDWHVVRRRGAANPPGNPDRLRVGRCGIYSGRAEYRTSPAGQRQASGYPETPAGSGKFSFGG